MASLKDAYHWEATLRDGSILTEGGDLRQAVMVSLTPDDGVLLPQHDFSGLRFLHRFIRYFKRTTIGGFDRLAYFIGIERNKTDSRVAARAARDQKGIVVEHPAIEPIKEQKPDACLSVIVARECRIYVNHATGAVLTTRPDYELYL